MLLLVKVLDLSFNTVFDRDFDPVGDWSYLGPGVGVLGDSIGAGWARVVAVLAGLATLAVLVGVPLAMLRLVKVADGAPPVSLTAATAFVSAWVLCFATGVQAVQGAPVASTSAASLTVDEVQLVRADLADLREFSDEIDADPYADGRGGPAGCSSGLRGKDVLVVFVESYGRVRRAGHVVLRRGSTQVLDAGHPASWRAAGYHVAERLPHLADVRRRQLAGARHPAVRAVGRQRAALRPAARRGPADADQRVRAGRLAHRLRRAGQHRGLARGRGRSTGSTRSTTPATSATQGPEFGYAPMPDQYTLEDFRRRELAPADRPPVMAEIDLVSSHHPWAPLPALVPWDEVGDGSVFDGMPEQGESSKEVFQDPDAVKRPYGESIEYSWQALVSFLDDLPRPRPGAGRRSATTSRTPTSAATTPATTCRSRVIAQDPAVMDADRRLGLAGRPAPRPRRAGLADGRVPRPVLHGVRA